MLFELFGQHVMDIIDVTIIITTRIGLVVGLGSKHEVLGLI